MSSNLKVNSLVPATGTEIGIGTTGGSIDFRCPATFGGNVTIGGTLTYDEVINIDSIGVITARSNIDCNGSLDVDGHTDLDNVSIAGVTTMTGNLTINSSSSARAIILPDNKRIYFGDDEDFWIGSNGSNGEVSGSLYFYNHQYHYDNVYARFGNGADLNIFHNGTNSIIDNNTGSLYIDSTDNIIFETGSSTERLRITSAGTLKFTGQNTSLETAGITHHTNNNLYIRGGTSGLVLGNHDSTNTIHISNSDYIKFETTDGSERLRINSTGQIITNGGSANPFPTRAATFQPPSGQTNCYISIVAGNTTSVSGLTFGDGADNNAANYAGMFEYRHNGDTLAYMQNGSDRLRIASDGDLTIVGSDNAELKLLCGSSSGNDIIAFQNSSGTTRGNITYDSDNNFLLFNVNQGERMRIDSNGQLLVGTTTSGANVRAVFQGYNGGGENFQARVQFQTAQQTNLTTNQHLANLLFTNASSSIGAEIRVQADEAWGTSDYPTRISFLTTANGSASRYERMIIKNDGVINIGVASPQYAKKVNIQGDNGYTLSLSNQDYTGHAAGSISGIEGRLQCGGGIWSSSGIRFVKHNGTSGDKHTRLELYANDGYASRNSLIIQPEGEITKPYQPSFRAGLSGNTTVNQSAYIIFNDTGSTWHHNIGNHYSTSNGRFTAPVDGVYQFNVCVIFGPFGGTNNVFMGDAFMFYVNGGNAGYSGRRGYYISGDSGNNYYTDHMSVNLKLSATDYVQIMNGSPFTAIHGNTYYTWFAGTLLG